MALKPPWYKVNTNVVVNEAESALGLGAVIRNSKGQFMAASICKKTFTSDIEFAKVEAAVEGIKLAIDLGIVPVVIELDFINVVDLINGKQVSNKKIGWLILNIQNILSKNNFFIVNLVVRNYNTVAHSLTKMALTQIDHIV
ncbi:Ribonuclease H-like superfamily protein [Melia azedarach]|uniref:Ribonuclease H-like superfamily protein n=1 Tax=Melia azedarach TaxID=155640 RepID=A0ACC1XCP5_MELAZ|nr:Ribonuclease H-like superfamily protein [Melia azedarach]